MGAKSPERCRLAAMIWLTLRPAAGSRVATVTKSGTAIGTGWTLPWVTSSLSTAAARRDESPASAAAPAPSRINRRRLSRLAVGNDSIIGRPRRRRSSAADHVARIESDLDVFPLLVMFGLEHVERLAAVERADGAVARGGEQRARPVVDHHGRGRERAVGLELDPDQHHQLLRVLGAGRDGPQLREPRAQRVELAQRH